MPTDLVTARYYISEAKNMAKRHVLRTDPALKQLYCKRCNCVLPKGKSGITSSNITSDNLVSSDTNQDQLFKFKYQGNKGKKRKRKDGGQKIITVDCQFCAYANHLPEKYWIMPEIVFKHEEDETNKLSQK